MKSHSLSDQVKHTNSPFSLQAFLLFSIAILLTLVTSTHANAIGTTPIYRGFNVDALWVTQQDINDLALTGANIARVSFNNLPIQDKTAPYALNPVALAKLDQILTWCQAVNVRVIIDPHTFPGINLNVTTMPDDPIWNDFAFHTRIISFWNDISLRYKNRGPVIFGYDLLNEPNILASAAKGGPGDWNLLVQKLVTAIRVNDKDRYLVVEAMGKKLVSGRWVNCIDGLDDLVLPKDSRLIVSPHMYLPLKFTHQGVFSYFNKTYNYPADIDCIHWDIAELRKVLQPVIRIQKKYNVPIFIGEFSAVRSLGDSGNAYLRDLIDICEENGWGWAYHSFRAAPVWDAEMSNIDAKDVKRYAVTPRMTMMKQYFSKNIILPL